MLGFILIVKVLQKNLVVVAQGGGSNLHNFELLAALSALVAR